MKKKAIALIMLVSMSVPSINAYADLEKDYLVLSKDGLTCEVTTLEMTTSEAAKMKKQNDVLVVEEDGYVQGCSETESTEGDGLQKEIHEKEVEQRSAQNTDTEWNMQAIKADNVENDKVDKGSKVKVALIDSGVDYTEDIDVYERKNFVPGEDDVSIIYEDASGHGTSIAGIIAAKNNDEGVTGINENVELYSAKVLDENNKAPISRVVNAIYWAIEKDVDIINISFGTTKDSAALKLAIEDANKAGILIIAAAGNNKKIEYPAAYDDVMAIGSVDSLGELSEESATGDKLELVAPGELILSTGGLGGISVQSGTSMAAPHVVGIASVLWQKDLSCSSDFIRQLLNLSANQYGKKDEYGYGLVDLNYALQLYDELKVVYEKAITNPIIELPTAEDKKIETATGSAIKTDAEGAFIESVAKTETEEESTDNAIKAAAEDTSIENTIKTKAEDASIENAIKDVKEEGGLADNTSEIIVFEDVNYVEGSWTRNEHTSMAENGDSSSFSTEDLNIIKKGARANDDYYPGMVAHPQWHGFGKNSDGTPSNYIDCYIYLTRWAESIGNGVYTAPPQVSMLIRDWNEMNSIISYEGIYNNKWDDIVGYSNTSEAIRKYFVYGMALHIATDIFAHSTFTTDGTYLSHTNEKADDPGALGNRNTCARQIAMKVVDHCQSSTEGSLSDFVLSKYNKSFMLYKMSTYAADNNESIYQDNKTYFDNMTR